MKEVTCARVGYGFVARLHEEKLRDFGVRTIAVTDTNPQKMIQAFRDGYIVFPSCREAAKLNFDFWDICASTSQHFEIIQKILSLNSQANILVEKPLCEFSEISKLSKTLEGFPGKITVNETYCSSEITSAVKQLAFEDIRIIPRRIIVEMTKNRTLDFLQGRFVDLQLGVLGYEGSHMLAIISQLGEEYLPGKIVESKWNDVLLETPQETQLLWRQGLADIKYISKSGIEVEFYTSMTGIVKHCYPPFGVKKIPTYAQTKYRVIAIEGSDRTGNNYSIVGFYEPIETFNRSEGAVAVIKNGKVVDVIAPIWDDHMGTHLQYAVQYFKGKKENPCSIEASIKIVELLHDMYSHSMKLTSSILPQQVQKMLA